MLILGSVVLKFVFLVDSLDVKGLALFFLWSARDHWFRTVALRASLSDHLLRHIRRQSTLSYCWALFFPNVRNNPNSVSKPASLTIRRSAPDERVALRHRLFRSFWWRSSSLWWPWSTLQLLNSFLFHLISEWLQDWVVKWNLLSWRPWLRAWAFRHLVLGVKHSRTDSHAFLIRSVKCIFDKVDVTPLALLRSSQSCKLSSYRRLKFIELLP